MPEIGNIFAKSRLKPTFGAASPESGKPPAVFTGFRALGLAASPRNDGVYYDSNLRNASLGWLRILGSYAELVLGICCPDRIAGGDVEGVNLWSLDVSELWRERA